MTRNVGSLELSVIYKLPWTVLDILQSSTLLISLLVCFLSFVAKSQPGCRTAHALVRLDFREDPRRPMLWRKSANLLEMLSTAALGKIRSALWNSGKAA